MGSRYSYQSKGNKPSIRVVWWVLILGMMILWLRNPLPLPIVIELMLAWLWFMGIVTLVLLVGRLIRGRRSNWLASGPNCLQVRLIPNRLALFHQRKQDRLPIFKHLSRID